MPNKNLLIVAHAPSPNTGRLRDAVLSGARSPGLDNIDAKWIAPLEAGPDDVFAAQAIILGTTENLGYMSGALKDFFDRTYNTLIEQTDALPYALLVRAGHDGTGTCRAVASITTGLRWKPAQDPIVCRGPWDDGFVDQAKELGTFMAAGLEMGII